jgi:hypothetical protein
MEREHRCFGRRVIRQSRNTNVAGYTRHRHNVSLVLCNHARKKRAHRRPVAQNVHIEDLAQVLVRRAQDAMRIEDTRIVDQHRRRTQLALHFLCRSKHGLWVCNVAAEEADVCVCHRQYHHYTHVEPKLTPLQPRRQRPDIQHRNLDSLVRQPLNNQLSKPTAPPGDNRDLTSPPPPPLLTPSPPRIQRHAIQTPIDSTHNSCSKQPLQRLEQQRSLPGVAQGAHAVSQPGAQRLRAVCEQPEEGRRERGVEREANREVQRAADGDRHDGGKVGWVGIVAQPDSTRVMSARRNQKIRRRRRRRRRL